MNVYEQNELSTTSESDSEYLVDPRYCRTTVKCKRKALKKTIKLIHGRCVVIYRGSADLLSIAAKDADRNCYCDFVFVCYDPKSGKLGKEAAAISRSRSAVLNSSSSNEDEQEDDYPTHRDVFQKASKILDGNRSTSRRTPLPVKTKLESGETSAKTKPHSALGSEPLSNNCCAAKRTKDQPKRRLAEEIIVEDVEIDVDEFNHSDEPSSSIIYFPASSSSKSKSPSKPAASK